jgi:hypothetical protein
MDQITPIIRQMRDLIHPGGSCRAKLGSDA